MTIGAGRWSRRAAVLAAALVVAALAGVPAAHAHPLGNFSVNHQTRVEISRDRVQLLYILDQAEIPTFQERRLSREEIIERKLAEVRRNLWLIVDGRRVTLRLRTSPRLTHPDGAGGLRITRLELPFSVRLSRTPRSVELRDLTFDERLGFADIVSLPGRGTAVTTFVSPRDPTNGLRVYKGITLERVPDQIVGKFTVRPGKGSLRDMTTGVTYGADEGPSLIPPSSSPGAAGGDGGAEAPSGDGFASVFEDAAQGEGVFVLFLLAAFGWGALHALSPGHGKTMVAAYLVGTRGTARHAVGLGAIVTVAHTVGVFALGLVTLLLAQYILPEDLYPWLNLAAGLLIVAVGIGVMRSRIRWGRQRREAHDHSHDHDHEHEHGDHHHHHPDPETGWKGIAGMGISAGIIPCPTALVVLLAAISQHQVGLGLLLICIFSLGLAATLTALGLGVVHGKRLMGRFGSRGPVTGRIVSMLPAASTLVILGLGIVLTAKAVPDIL